ncbi:SWIM zinc finger family protein [Corynebacterium atypicum]|uniref:SWIM zinc finger family protein n=1 Tax=Corynebacterium atypicum TaxID=191610 RepID=UPI00068DB5BB|nr:hypothetical protein [Corynebacterium atypicum]
MVASDHTQRRHRYPSEGNVIFANFGRREHQSPARPDGAGEQRAGGEDRALRFAQGRAGKTAWARHNDEPVATRKPYSPAGRRLVDALFAATDLGRVKRGWDYATSGNVVALQLMPGRIVGSVAGSQNQPFSTTIELPYRATDELTEVTRVLAAKPGAVSQARRGEVPEEILDVVLYRPGEEIHAHCDCPDQASVCKHAIALGEVAADRLAQRPGELFELRGLNIDGLAREVARRSQKVAEDNARGSGQRFWQGLDVPPLPEPDVQPALDESDIDLLHQAMRQVSYTAVEQLQAVSDIEDLYDHLTGQAGDGASDQW